MREHSRTRFLRGRVFTIQMSLPGDSPYLGQSQPIGYGNLGHITWPFLVGGAQLPALPALFYTTTPPQQQHRLLPTTRPLRDPRPATVIHILSSHTNPSTTSLETFFSPLESTLVILLWLPLLCIFSAFSRYKPWLIYSSLLLLLYMPWLPLLT
jgi:hypothetical protein